MFAHPNGRIRSPRVDREPGGASGGQASASTSKSAAAGDCGDNEAQGQGFRCLGETK